MLDIRWIKQNQEQVQTIADQKGIQLSIQELLILDERKRELLKQVEELRYLRNQFSDQVAVHLKNKDAGRAEDEKQKVKKINGQLTALENEWTQAEEAFQELSLLVPNIVSRDTPVGNSDADNIEIRRYGEPRLFDFEWKDHIALGELHRMFDIKRGVKTAGTRSYYLTGTGVLLHRAVQQLALDHLLQKGFTPLDVPLLVRGEAMLHTGFFPLGQDQTYRIAGEDRWLVGTSEVPLISFYANEIIDVNDPIKLAGASVCFRNEIGSAGKDVHGLYRVYQFAKVEQVVFCRAEPALSENILQEITKNAEELLQLLELPYRVMAVCTGDMSQKTYKQYDIETWMPSRQAYGETHSSSNLHDFQARRANIRYRDESGRLQFCHTLNNTAVATPRILIPLLENHQEEDGSIRIPKALRPYLYGLERLVPNQ